jgi:anti-sigma B factor antagonist
MRFTVERWENATLAVVEGRIDESTAQSFGDQLIASVEHALGMPATKVVVDCSGIDYMSSRGLRALTLGKRAADEAGVVIVLAAPNEIMREIFAISRYDKLFAVTDSLDAAS